MNIKKVAILGVVVLLAFLAVNALGNKTSKAINESDPVVVEPVEKPISDPETEPSPDASEWKAPPKEEPKPVVGPDPVVDDPVKARLQIRRGQLAALGESKTADVISVSLRKGLSDQYIAFLETEFKDVPVDNDGQPFLQFETQADREAAESVIFEKNGFISSSLEEEAAQRKLSCGVSSCVGSVEGFSDLMRQAGISTETEDD